MGYYSPEYLTLENISILDINFTYTEKYKYLIRNTDKTQIYTNKTEYLNENRL